MNVTLKIDDPIIAIMGPERSVGWGPCQFPAIRKLPDGRLVIFYHVGQDICEEYGKDSGWLISDDGGDSWHEVAPEEMPAVKGLSGTKLPSGKTSSNFTKGESLCLQMYSWIVCCAS